MRQPLLDEWRLRTDGPGLGGDAEVLLVRRGSEPLVLKLRADAQAAVALEALALRHWAGHGAVRLVAADPARGALLLERLDAAVDLSPVWIDQACEEIGALLPLLHRPAPLNVPVAVDRLRAVLNEPSVGSLPRRMVERARRLLGDLPDERRLLHGALTCRHVLAESPDSEEVGWRAISPRPEAGHPGLDLVPLLLDRPEEYPDGSGLRWGVRQRLALVCEAAGLDEEVARPWAYVGLLALTAQHAATSADVSFPIAVLKTLDG